MPANADEKTEAPTPRRRQEARGRGQVPRSQDLTAVLILLTALLLLRWYGPALFRQLVALVADGLGEHLAEAPLWPPSSDYRLVGWMLSIVWPFPLLVAVVALAASIGQVGWFLSFEPLKPHLARLNPLNGFGRLFSMRSWFQLVINLGKLLLVTLIVWMTLRKRAGEILIIGQLPLEALLSHSCMLVYDLGLRLCLLLLVLAVLDYAYQRYQHERDLRMTKQEVKDEFKNMEGDPAIRQRRRRVQLELYRQRLQQDVRKADMVLTNPTHLSIALKYDPDTMPAPRVVAKGEDYWALHIRRIAEQAGIPIVERKALVRRMYPEVRVRDYIPEKFYKAVAEILAYVYRLSGRKTA